MRFSRTFYRMWRFVLLRTLPVLLVPMLLMIYICNVSVQRNRENAYESQLHQLRSGIAKVEHILENAADLILYLEGESGVKQLLTSPGPMVDGVQTLDFINIQQNIHSLAVSNALYACIQIYAPHSDTLIDSSTLALVPERYYGRVFQMEGLNCQQWSEEYLHRDYNMQLLSRRTCSFFSHEDRYLVMAHSYPTGLFSYTTGNVFIYLKEYDLLARSFNVSRADSGFVLALNAQGKIVMQHGQAPTDMLTDEFLLEARCADLVSFTMDGREMLLVHSPGEKHGLDYYSAIPMDQVLAPTLHFRTTIIVLMVLVGLVGLGLIIFCSARLSEPVSNLYTLVAPSEEPVTFDDVSASIHALIQQKESLQEQLSQQAYHYRMAVFHELLLGNANDAMTEWDYRRQLGIDRTYPAYVTMVVVLSDIGDYSEDHLGVRMYIRQALQSCIPALLEITDWGYDKFVLLAGVETQGSTQAIMAVNEAVERLSGQMHNGQVFSLAFYADLCQSLSEVSIAFHHALSMLQRTDKDTSSIVQWHRFLQPSPSVFAYPIEVESKLISSTLSGDAALVQKCFDEITSLNQPLLHANSAQCDDLLLALRSTWLRLCSDGDKRMDVEPVLSLVDGCLNGSSDRSDCLAHICRAFQGRAMNLNGIHPTEITDAQKRIKEYVDTHYVNPNISLVFVADEFHLSEVYLSKLFKQITGENFSKYIEQLRLTRANELLQQHMPIKDVAQAVGYNSPQVFRRAYKRMYGISPSDKTFSE